MFLPFICHLHLYGDTNFFVHICLSVYFFSSRFAIYPTARDQGSSYSCYFLSCLVLFLFFLAYFFFSLFVGIGV